MKVVPGKRDGSSLYFHKNFSYNKDKRLIGTFRCSSRRTTCCPGLLKKSEKGYILKTKHNHGEDRMPLQKSDMRQAMLAMCHDTLLPPKEIFDGVCRSNPEAALHLSYASIKSVMNRERAKCRPPLPKSAGELKEILQRDEALNLIYQGSVVATDGTTALLFSSQVLLEELAVSKELYVDGLCSGICAIFALCEARSTALYCAIWNKIVELVPELQENVEFTMSDYERAALNALEKFFPSADVHCCWFHFKQAVTRKWKSLGLKVESDLLSMTKSLPLVPAEKFEEALDILDDVGKNDSNVDDKVSRFLKYLRSTWLPLASKVSVFKCRQRTNNIVESFNNKAHRKLGGSHPNLWVFLSHLKNFIQDQELDLGRLKNKQAIGRPRRRKDIERDARIFQAQTDFASGRLPLVQLLRMFDHRPEWNYDDIDGTEDNDDSQADILDDNDVPEYVECEAIITEDETSLDQEGNRKQDELIEVFADTSTEEIIERSAVRDTGPVDRAPTFEKKPLHGKKRLPFVVLERIRVSTVENRTLDGTVPIAEGDSLVPTKRKPLSRYKVPKRARKQPVRYHI